MKLRRLLALSTLLLPASSCSKPVDVGQAHKGNVSDSPSLKDVSNNSVPSQSKPQSAPALILTSAGVNGAQVGTFWRVVSDRFEQAGTDGVSVAEDCDTLKHRGGDFAAMVVDGKIARIEIDKPGILTAEGIGVGSSLSRLKEAYGKQLIAEPNTYGGEDNYFVWQAKDRGLVFYMSDGKVRYMAGGGEAIRYVEGCL